MNSPMLSSQQELTDEEKDLAFKKLFAKVFATGWRIGFYEDPDKPVVCPFVDSEQKEWFNWGVSDGFDAKCQMQEEGII